MMTSKDGDEGSGRRSTIRRSRAGAGWYWLLVGVIGCGSVAPAQSELPYRPGSAASWEAVVGVATDPAVRKSGTWREEIFRRSFPTRTHWLTDEDGAAIERTFDSAGLVLLLETHVPYVYSGAPNSGLLEVSIDGEVARILNLLVEPTEVVLYRDRDPVPRRIRLRHRVAPNGGRGARVIGFRELDAPSGDLTFSLGGEAADLMVDARLTVLRDAEVVRSLVQRNWISGMIRLAGLPPGAGYRLRIEAFGWVPKTIPLPPIHAGSERVLASQDLKLDRDLLTNGILSPRLGYPTVKRPGDGLDIRLERPEPGARVPDLKVVRWHQRIGEAERTVTLWQGLRPIPSDGVVRIDLPRGDFEGLGDLTVEVQGPRGTREWRAPQSLHLRPQYPAQPVFLTLGHLDCWGQYQGEYLAVVADVANLIRPDAVLFSNDVNPAYVAGGLQGLQVPHVTTIGNHSFGYALNPSFLDAAGRPQPGPAFTPSVSIGTVSQGHHHREPHHAWRGSANRAFDRWFGDPIGVFELAPDVAVLNYGWSWNPEFNGEAIARAGRIFDRFRQHRIRILNAYEGDPPAGFLRRHDFALVSSAHGWPALAKAFAPEARRGGSSTQFRSIDGRTWFVGKRSADTFRLVRFAADRVVSVSYAGDDQHLFPLDRHRVAPLRVEFSSDPGGHRAHLINDYEESLSSCRIDWVLPRGDYTVTGGAVRSRWESDDGRWSVLFVATDAPAGTSVEVRARPTGG